MKQECVLCLAQAENCGSCWRFEPNDPPDDTDLGMVGASPTPEFAITRVCSYPSITAFNVAMNKRRHDK